MKFATFRFRPALWYGPAILGILLLAACDYVHTGLSGSGKTATENRNVAAFSKIAIDGSADIEASIGGNTSVTVTIDNNLLPIIETVVEGDTLHIHPTESYSSSMGLKVKIVSPTLEAVSVSGAANIDASGLDAKTFALSVSGAGHSKLEGKTDQLDVRVSGTGDIQAGNLTAKEVKISISGAGDAVVNATQSLDASVSGVGSVRYSGQPPQVRQNVSGVGSINPL